jgi:hypothetical protein
LDWRHSYSFRLRLHWLRAANRANPVKAAGAAKPLEVAVVRQDNAVSAVQRRRPVRLLDVRMAGLI